MTDLQHDKTIIESGGAYLGCELGSTNIKATLITSDSKPLASGSHRWENRLVDGMWTYHPSDILTGLEECFADLAANVQHKYGISLTRIAGAGVSAMMHGYIAVDEQGELLVPFRTWRNTNTGAAASELTDLFNYPIPQRWSIAHLYQAILNNEAHLPRVRHITTLAGYVHWKLTGRWAIGAGDASGMFPIDLDTGKYDARMIEQFNQHVAAKGYPWALEDILPEIVTVGESAGQLTDDGARILEPAGNLQAGVNLCPPEGDAGTGMVATNCIRPRTGNVSAGTSVFGMLVLERSLSKVHPEIDLVVTPDGNLVGMAHSNNCTSDLNGWMSLFGEVVRILGLDVKDSDLYGRLIPLALTADADAGGLLNFCYLSGEHLTGLDEGRPLFIRQPDAAFTLPNFIRVHLFSALAALRIGLDVLTEQEGVRVEEIRGHGGIFKTPGVGQLMMAAATRTPVSVPETAGEGGSWGMAILASYMLREDRSLLLADYLDRLIGDSIGAAMAPRQEDVEGFSIFLEHYKAGLIIEETAVEHFR